MDELLGCKLLNLIEIRFIAKGLETEYEYVLAYFYDALENNFKGDILKTIKNAHKLLCEKNKVWINCIRVLKNG